MWQILHLLLSGVHTSGQVSGCRSPPADCPCQLRHASVANTFQCWPLLSSLPPPDIILRTMQRAWDDAICGSHMQNLLAATSGAHRTRLLASGSPGSGSWLHALPFANLGLPFASQELRVAIGLCFFIFKSTDRSV